jgi:hypothetical protein
MLIIGKFRRSDPKDSSLFERSDRVDGEYVDSRKIIDFESAKQAFERDHPIEERSEESERTFLSDFRADRSGAGVAESLVTVVLILIIGLSLLLGMIWGF